MIKKCIICDAEFKDEELLKKHVNEHLSESVLNKPIEESVDIDSSFENQNPELDIKKIFSEEKFEKLIESKINTITDVQEIIKRRNFVEQIKKINRRNPFCYPSYIVTDYILGVSTTILQERYHIWYWMDLYNITHYILKFSENRYNSIKYRNARELNLKISGWNQKYQDFKDNCKFFENEINELFFDNVLQTYLIFLLMDEDSGIQELSISCKELKNHYDIFHFIDFDLAKIFNKILETNLEERIESILIGLKQENVVIRSRSDPKKFSINFSIDEIKNSIIKELKIYRKLQYSTLRASITNKFPSLRLLPKFNVFGTAWRELEKEKRIHIEWTDRTHSVFFLNEDYQKIDSDIKSIEKNQSKIPFRGRKITPDRFIAELLELETGDFGDEDDQVTRLAGLVLAESVKLQTPHEKIKEFDFTVDIKNYQFRPEQLEAIAKLDFKIESEILHVKVMIEEEITYPMYNKLREKIPPNEQGVIITFQKIPNRVQKELDKNNTIQIIDEEGVRTWVSITANIPARVNSISKITFDPLSKLENKIVKIDSMFYETGMAIVSVLPEMNEETVLARTLEEIELPEADASTFNDFARNYLEFLGIIHEISNESDIFNAFFKNKFEVIDRPTEASCKIKFENHEVNIQLNKPQLSDVLQCTCFKWIEDRSHLCEHLIASLDWIARNSKYFHPTLNDRYIAIEHALEVFLAENISADLDNLVYEIKLDEDKSLLGDFVSKILKS